MIPSLTVLDQPEGLCVVFDFEREKGAAPGTFTVHAVFRNQTGRPLSSFVCKVAVPKVRGKRVHRPIRVPGANGATGAGAEWRGRRGG